MPCYIEKEKYLKNLAAAATFCSYHQLAAKIYFWNAGIHYDVLFETLPIKK